MIRLIVGNKGSGKTKQLLENIKTTLETSKGNVVCIEKGDTLRFDVTYRARLIDVDEYKINSFDGFYGFCAGLFAGNYDITDVFVDGTFKTCGKDYEAFGQLVDKLVPLLEKNGATMTFTVSCDKTDLPERVLQYIV